MGYWATQKKFDWNHDKGRMHHTVFHVRLGQCSREGCARHIVLRRVALSDKLGS